MAYSPVQFTIPLGYYRMPVDLMKWLEFCSCLGVDGGGSSSYGPMDNMVMVLGGLDTCDL